MRLCVSACAQQGRCCMMKIIGVCGGGYVCVCVCVCVCVRACVHACVRACVRAYVRACVRA